MNLTNVRGYLMTAQPLILPRAQASLARPRLLMRTVLRSDRVESMNWCNWILCLLFEKLCHVL